MHIVYIGYLYDADLPSEEALLERCPTIPAYAEALAAAGAKVTVLQRFSHASAFANRGVAYQFFRDRCPPAPRWQVPFDFHHQIARAVAHNGDAVVHANGLIFPLQTGALRASLAGKAPLVIQHHGERPWGGLKRRLQQRGLASADAFLFASSELSKDWFDSGIFSREQAVYEVMESPVTVKIAAARTRTLHGAPVFLWVGRLNSGKDPLTVLSGFEQAARHVPSARLYMAYGGDDMLAAVRERIATSDALASRVALLGRVPHGEMPGLYAGADCFVLGSHAEGSGYALAEAMAHGVTPVVTKIPAFATMAEHVAEFWTPGDAADCARAMLAAMATPLHERRLRVLRRFEEFLSARAIAGRALAAYADVIRRRRDRP